jgi:hypothetical protein
VRPAPYTDRRGLCKSAAKILYQQEVTPCE